MIARISDIAALTAWMLGDRDHRPSNAIIEDTQLTCAHRLPIIQTSAISITSRPRPPGAKHQFPQYGHEEQQVVLHNGRDGLSYVL